MALNPRSRAPRRKRLRWNWPRPVRERILRLRCRHANLGKDKVHKFLRPWCEARGYPVPSASTIGRLIADHPSRMRVTSPANLDRRGRPKPRRRSGISSERVPGWAGRWWGWIDCSQGRRRYVPVDLYSRFGFALGTHSHTSTTAALFLEHVLLVFPGSVEAVLSDNGSEFQGAFDKVLKERGIRHCVTRPKSPKMNAHAERFNRTVQEEFVQFEEDLLFTDVPLFNEKCLEWLLLYNTERPHHSLGNSVRWSS